MTQIVGIHGIGQTYRTAAKLESEWFEALQGGLEEAGRARISRDSFQMVSYGALYRGREPVPETLLWRPPIYRAIGIRRCWNAGGRSLLASQP